jgi:protease I
MSKQENLNALRVAILVENGFEQREMIEPRNALDKSGAKITIVSPSQGRVRGWKFGEWDSEFQVDIALDKANPQDYDHFCFLVGS